MRISELIEELEKIKAEHGDVTVLASVPYAASDHTPEFHVRRDGVLIIFGGDD